jgi:hypothetical protein
MSDIIDQANDKTQDATDAAIEERRRAAAAMPAGEAGECDWGGEVKARLVNGACGRCRDLWRLP